VDETSLLTYDIHQSLIISKTYIQCHIPIFNPDLRIELAIPPLIKNGIQKIRLMTPLLTFGLGLLNQTIY